MLLFKKTTYSRFRKLNCFQKPAVDSCAPHKHLQRLFSLRCSKLPLLWSLGRDPSHILAIQGARSGVCSWASRVLHTRFPRQTHREGTSRGTGRRRAEQRRGGTVRWEVWCPSSTTCLPYHWGNTNETCHNPLLLHWGACFRSAVQNHLSDRRPKWQSYRQFALLLLYDHKNQRDLMGNRIHYPALVGAYTIWVLL